MRCLALLFLFLLLPPAMAAETGGAWPDRAAFSDLAARLIPREELTLIPLSPQAYPAGSPFADSIRYDDARIALPPDAAPERVAAAARALAARPSDAAGIQARLQEALSSGKPVSALSFLPELARSLTGRAPKPGDANCFNAALLWDGLACEPRYTDDWELENAVAGRFRPLASGERLRHGDLLLLSSVDHKERLTLQHAARYVGDDLVWHKADRTSRTPWTLERLPDMLRPYVERIGQRWVDLELKAFRLTP